MLTSKRNIVTVAAVIATATMAAGLGAVALIAGGRASPSPPRRRRRRPPRPIPPPRAGWHDARGGLTDAHATNLGRHRRRVGGDRRVHRAGAAPGAASGRRSTVPPRRPMPPPPARRLRSGTAAATSSPRSRAQRSRAHHDARASQTPVRARWARDCAVVVSLPCLGEAAAARRRDRGRGCRSGGAGARAVAIRPVERPVAR